MRLRAQAPAPLAFDFPVRAAVAARCITVRRHSARDPAPSARERDTRATSRPLRNARPPRALATHRHPEIRFGVLHVNCASFWLWLLALSEETERRAGGGPAQLRLYRRCCARISPAERSARGLLAARPPPGAPSRHTTLHYYTVGHEKSRSFAGCPYQRVRGDFHLSSSRGHTALVDDRRALRP